MNRFNNAAWLNSGSTTQPTSDKQREANRHNAQHATGPISEAGKARSRMNAQKHGLYTQREHWQQEQQAEYTHYKAELTERFQPNTPTAEALVADVAELEYRLGHVLNAYIELQCNYRAKQAMWSDADCDETLEEQLTLTLRIINSMDKLSRLEARLQKKRDALVMVLAQLCRPQPTSSQSHTTHSPNGFVLDTAEDLGANAPLQEASANDLVASFATGT